MKREAMLQGKIRPLKKCDADNIAKIICDGLNGIAYPDDKQITSLSVEKWYSDNPKVIVIISNETGKEL
ncbi:RusA family crossover junction endodeoxyribonuclease [Coprococcus eutactus]|uniref:RusA family crossover junction endodeoxyribonuclease n=1 Tax=Coprococcus eutactus TaxID=33043 RepID=A0A412ITV7_9FIRM|nr:RusA family crossover junction endodeoxyribonuclease [Coprococcus eutactus]